MLTEIKDVLSRSSDTIWQDIAGGVGLTIVLVAIYNLPGFL
ncbi:MAG: hypothetical protein P8X50_15200 [Maritimibacter sp.]|jgi:hypothetical protein